MQLNTEDKKFLNWLCQRLIFKHKYHNNDFVIEKLKGIINSQCINVSSEDLDAIIGKYYVDFFLEKTDGMNIGYTNKERIDIRNKIKSIVEDVNNKNIPTNIIK